MGNSHASSPPGLSVDPFVQIIEYGHKAIRDGNEHVSQEQFERLFGCLSPAQSAALWHKLFPHASDVDLPTFAAAVRDLESVRSDDGRLRFVLSLVEREERSEDAEDIPYVGEFLRWCAAPDLLDSGEVARVAHTLVKNFLPLDEGKTPSVDAFVRWSLRNCPEMAHDLCSCITESLRTGNLTLPWTKRVREVTRLSGVDAATLWLLSCSLPELFKCNQKRGGGRLLDKFNLEKMSHLHLLFDSHEHGLSSSRLRQQVFDYEAPTLTFVEFDEQSYCVALDSTFKEHWAAYGGPNTSLYSIKPKFCRLLNGENLVYSNFSTKSGKRCIAVGRNATQAPVLECDDGLSTGRVFGLSHPLRRLQVWGCGGDADALLQKMAELKEWERKEAARQRDRKFKGEAWEDSPDRTIMSWGGVQATHSEMVGKQEDQEEEEAVQEG